MAELYAFQSPKSRSMTAMLTPEQANHLLRLQRDVLAEVVQNGDGQKALDLLCRTAESLLPNSAASVMVFDPERQGLQVKAAPSVPEEAVKALNGLKPGERAGSCGTAVFKGEPQFVCDTTIDPRWAGEAFQWFVKTFDLMACWSVPIHRGSEVIGSMALSSFEKRRPSEFHRMLLETCAHLAGIILEREREQQKLWDLAHYDHLTGLPNRRLFHLMLDRAIQRARDHDGRLALLFIDLDNFKDINDNFGHNTGDLVLQRVAENIRHDLRAENVIARLGGDEFVVLLEDIETQDQIHQMADRLMAAIKTPVHVDGNDYRLSASIGISLFPEDGADLQSLHKHADLAMYEAKARGRGRYIRYRPDLSRKLQMRVRLVDDLREALAERRLTLAFQPQVAAATGRLSGVEALVRWHHPRMGWIAPPSFVPLAEQCGLIDALGNWVLEAACRQCLAWWRQGLPGFDLAVNVSVLQLHGGFAEWVIKMLENLHFPASRLELEVTESLLMESGSEALETLARLRRTGIRVAMDDFGTGHSSLAQLKRMPIDRLKIDRSFVRDIPEDPNDEIIARTIIAMGHGLDLAVVAEGVETGVQKDFLIREGCDHLQGYLIARPLPGPHFQRWLQERSRSGR